MLYPAQDSRPSGRQTMTQGVMTRQSPVLSSQDFPPENPVLPSLLALRLSSRRMDNEMRKSGANWKPFKPYNA